MKRFARQRGLCPSRPGRMLDYGGAAGYALDVWLTRSSLSWLVFQVLCASESSQVEPRTPPVDPEAPPYGDDEYNNGIASVRTQSCPGPCPSTRRGLMKKDPRACRPLPTPIRRTPPRGAGARVIVRSPCRVAGGGAGAGGSPDAAVGQVAQVGSPVT
jgi:hypothetical protein